MKKQTQNKIDALSDGDIEKIGNLLDNRLAPFATKVDIKDTEDRIKTELKAYIHEGVETIMDGMDRLSEQLAEKERVDKLEQWTRIIAKRVGVELV